MQKVVICVIDYVLHFEKLLIFSAIILTYSKYKQTKSLHLHTFAKFVSFLIYTEDANGPRAGL